MAGSSSPLQTASPQGVRVDAHGHEGGVGTSLASPLGVRCQHLTLKGRLDQLGLDYLVQFPAVKLGG